jgi:hypothetical protein
LNSTLREEKITRCARTHPTTATLREDEKKHFVCVLTSLLRCLVRPTRALRALRGSGGTALLRSGRPSPNPPSAPAGLAALRPLGAARPLPPRS